MINIKQNDTRPAAATILSRGDVIVDLTQATSVTFKMREQGRLDLKVNAGATITDMTGGAVEYRWSIGDTDTVGMYDAEWEVLWADNTVETFPTLATDIVRIGGDLDGS